jgi:acylphosphatase
MSVIAHNAFYARVSGRVQGVGFRYSAVREAQRQRLNGWVRNASNGDVEIWAEGPPEKLELFLAWLWRGPAYSRVDSVEKEDKPPRGYRDFGVEY